MGRLVWLFQEHRDLYERSMQQARVIDDLKRVIADLETALTAKAVQDAGASALIKQYQDEVLAEIPYPDGKIPAHVWLTPGEDERPEK